MKRLDSSFLAAFSAAAIAGSLLAACGDRGSAPPQTAAASAPGAHVKLDVTSTYPTSLTLVGEAAPRVKWLWSAKPTATATSARERAPAASSSRALWIRTCTR